MSWPLPINQVEHTQFGLSSGEPHSAMPLKEGPLWAAEAAPCPDKHPISKMLFCFADWLVVSGRKRAGLPSTRSGLMWLGCQGKETHTHIHTHSQRSQLETWGKQNAWKAHIPSSHPRMCHHQAVSRDVARVASMRSGMRTSSSALDSLIASLGTLIQCLPILSLLKLSQSPLPVLCLLSTPPVVTV